MYTLDKHKYLPRMRNPLGGFLSSTAFTSRGFDFDSRHGNNSFFGDKGKAT